MNNILGIIPARIGSTRLPRKPLADILGKTLIQRTYESCLKSHLVKDFIVATDSQEILEHVESFGGKATLTSESHNSGTQRVAEVALREENNKYDFFLNVQGDQPILDVEHIDSIALKYLNAKSEIITPIVSFKTKEDLYNPGSVKVVLNKNKEALYFSRNIIPYNRERTPVDLAAEIYWKHIGIYGYSKAVLENIKDMTNSYLERLEVLEQLTWLYEGYRVQCVEVEKDVIAIDTHADLENVINFIKQS